MAIRVMRPGIHPLIQILLFSFLGLPALFFSVFFQLHVAGLVGPLVSHMPPLDFEPIIYDINHRETARQGR